MSQLRVDDRSDQTSRTPWSGRLAEKSWAGSAFEKFVARPRIAAGSCVRRLTPRVCVILILPEDQFLDAERLALGLVIDCDNEVDFTIVYAGEPSNLDALKRAARTARFLMAPRGTIAEDLREFAMEQTPGDIVTLLDAAHLGGHWSETSA